MRNCGHGFTPIQYQCKGDRRVAPPRYVRSNTPAHGKLEWIIVQRLAAAGFHNHRSAELQAGLEVARDRIGLNGVDHVFSQGPRLQRVRRAARAQLRCFPGFAMKDAIVSGEAVFLYHRSCRDQFLACRARLADLAHALVTFEGNVEHFPYRDDASRRRCRNDWEVGQSYAGSKLAMTHFGH